MAEWFKVHAWKVCVPSQVPWVRIPLSPPLINSFKIYIDLAIFLNLIELFLIFFVKKCYKHLISIAKL
jgi:hypothetical protein